MDPEQAEIVLFSTYSSVAEASIVKSKLDAYGIPNFLTNENMATLYPSNMVGGIRLNVRKADLERVREVLDSND